MMPTTYGLFAAVGCVTAVLWLNRHRRGLGVSENEFWAAMWVLLIGGVVGAKGLFVALGWEHYARGELRLWTDFQVGFVFFGGLAGHEILQPMATVVLGGLVTTTLVSLFVVPSQYLRLG
ncbi:MAG: prolipoprotein diacylglyceryl transferase family protein, partial [Gammaproteobacteria bacterium]